MPSSPEAIRQRVRESGGQELLERLDALDAARFAESPEYSLPRMRLPRFDGAHKDFDVVLLGGGLSMLVVPLLTQMGLKVAVVDRHRAGVAHREWNASRDELAVLVDSGVMTHTALDRLVVGRYRHGICRFFGGPDYPVQGVLDHAVDAGALLAYLRKAAESQGVTFLDGFSCENLHENDRLLRCDLVESTGQSASVTCGCVLDGRGACSPYNRADMVCPTVGGVLEGLQEGSAHDQVQYDVGDILVTTQHADERNVQLIWEGFPGRRGQYTTYLFHYSLRGRPLSLIALYSRFFDLLPQYKRGAPRLIKPTFGYIPGWSRLSPPPRSPSKRLILMGDAASRHSPLTYCGFGSMLRSFQAVAKEAVACVEGTHGHVTAVKDEAIHLGTGALSWIMASERLEGSRLNVLLNAAFATLHQMGNASYAALLRDEMDIQTFIQFLWKTSRRYPKVYRDVLKTMGPFMATRWFTRLLARA